MDHFPYYSQFFATQCASMIFSLRISQKPVLSFLFTHPVSLSWISTPFWVFLISCLGETTLFLSISYLHCSLGSFCLTSLPVISFATNFLEITSVARKGCSALTNLFTIYSLVKKVVTRILPGNISKITRLLTGKDFFVTSFLVNFGNMFVIWNMFVGSLCIFDYNLQTWKLKKQLIIHKKTSFSAHCNSCYIFKTETDFYLFQLPIVDLNKLTGFLQTLSATKIHFESFEI